MDAASVSITLSRIVLMRPLQENTWVSAAPTTAGIVTTDGRIVVAGTTVIVTVTAMTMIGTIVVMIETVNIVIEIGKIEGPLLRAAAGTPPVEGATRAAHEEAPAGLRTETALAGKKVIVFKGSASMFQNCDRDFGLKNG